LDELYDLAQGTRQYAEACGHELFYSEHAGIDHTIIAEDLPIALDWFLARPHPCIASDTPPAGSAGFPGTAGSGGLSADSGIASGSGGGTATDPVGAAPTESPSDITDMYADHMSRTPSSDAGSCGCRVASRGDGRTAGVAMLVGLAAVLMRRRRSVRMARGFRFKSTRFEVRPLGNRVRR
jgi:MYXO-CTERM domain-containing protein